MEEHHTTDILRFLIVLSCYLPPLPVFTDPLLVPKWYMFALCGLMYMTSLCFKVRKSDGRPWHFALQAWFQVLVWGNAAECIYVIFQMMLQGHNPIGERGTFDNPAGLALSMALTIPMAAFLMASAKILKERFLYALCTLLMIAVLVLTKSRTGLVCLACFTSVLMVMICRKCLHKKAYRYVGAVVLLSAVVIATASYISAVKKDSTSGRWFILMRSWEMIVQKPLTGYGINGFDKEYMHRQAEHFRSHPDCEYAMLADEVHHPLNEFIFAWVIFGLFGMLTLLAILMTLMLGCARQPVPIARILSLPLSGLAVFCCFSYPLQYPISWLVLLMSLSALTHKSLRKLREGRLARWGVMALCGGLLIYVVREAACEWRWNHAYRRYYKHRHEKTLERYDRLYPSLNRNKYFLYNYAFAAYRMHDAGKAYRIVKECVKLRRDYNTELLSADICRKLGRYEEAIRHYDEARHMCPVRFAPLEGLYRVYEEIGDSLNMAITAETIATKKVKLNTSDVIRIKEYTKTEK